MTATGHSCDRIREDWPVPPNSGEDHDIVLHTRVVTDSGGGPDKTILLSAPFLAHTNYWLAAAYMHPPDDPGFEALRRRAEEVGCPLISLPDRGPLDRKVLRRLLELCRLYNVAIWHGHDYKSNLLGLMLRPFWSMKLVSTVHGWVKQTTRTPLYYAVDRFALPYYDQVICVSDDLAQRMQRLGVPDSRLSLIHNAIDLHHFSRKYPAADSPLRRKYDVPAQRLIVGAVGRLSPEKGFGDLIRAMSVLLAEKIDVQLWIAGNGESRETLQKLIDHLDANDRIELLGFVADTVELYAAMDVFVLSSLREGLPNVVLEAAAMSVPIVATRVAGVPDMIRDGHQGLLCPIGDPDALISATRRVVTDESLRARLARNARALIEQRYSFKRRMAKVSDIYDRLLDQHRVSRNN